MSKDDVQTTAEEEVLDTSTNEEVDTSDEESWDDDEGFDLESENLDDESEESDDEESDDESETDEVTADESEDENPEPEAEKQTEEDTASDEQETEVEETEDKSKEELAQEAFKRREAERQLREERERNERQQLEAYLAAARDDEAEFTKRRNEVERHLLNKERSAVLEEKLETQVQRAFVSFGLDKADSTTKNFIARQLDKFEASNVLRDRAGNIVEVRGDVYQYIKEEMDSIGAFRSIGAREQKQNKAKEQSRTIVKPTRTPKEPPKDPELDAFDEEANRW